MTTPLPVSPTATSFYEEFLTGDPLVEAIFGPQSNKQNLKKARKRLYRLIAEVPPAHRLLCFKLGNGQIAARRAWVEAFLAANRQWIAEQEQKALAAAGITADDLARSELPAGAALGCFAALSEEARRISIVLYRRKIEGTATTPGSGPRVGLGHPQGPRPPASAGARAQSAA
jgi:hypothetical protein